MAGFGGASTSKQIVVKSTGGVAVKLLKLISVNSASGIGGSVLLTKTVLPGTVCSDALLKVTPPAEIVPVTLAGSMVTKIR